MKQCKGPCGETLSLMQFYDHPTNSDGKQRVCKDCTKRAVRESRCLMNDEVCDEQESLFPIRPTPEKQVEREEVFPSQESEFAFVGHLFLRGPSNKHFQVHLK